MYAHAPKDPQHVKLAIFLFSAVFAFAVPPFLFPVIQSL